MNKTAIFYDEKGMITRIRTGPTANVAATVAESAGLYVYFDDLPDTENKYIFEESLVSMGDKPSLNHDFDYETKQWVFNTTEAKIDKWRLIKKSREETEVGSFTKDAWTFQSDQQSQRRILSTLQIAQSDPAVLIDWTLADNSTHTFTGLEFIEVGNALSLHVSACHAKASGLRVQIETATTQAELDAITW